MNFDLFHNRGTNLEREVTKQLCLPYYQLIYLTQDHLPIFQRPDRDIAYVSIGGLGPCLFGNVGYLTSVASEEVKAHWAHSEYF